MRPPTPTSFVKLAASDLSLIIGESSSTPTSDHVPELTKHQLLPGSAGTAATAEAVSCPAVINTSAPRRPHRSTTCGANEPILVPDFTKSGRMRVGILIALESALQTSP